VVPSESAFQVLKPDNNLVTTLTGELLNAQGHSFANFNGGALGNTTNYGLIPSVNAPEDADNFIGNNPYVTGTLEIAFNVSGPVTAADLSNVYFLFGAADPPNAIIPGTLMTPEPASVTLLVSGFLAFGGFGLYRRRRGRAPESTPAC